MPYYVTDGARYIGPFALRSWASAYAHDLHLQGRLAGRPGAEPAPVPDVVAAADLPPGAQVEPPADPPAPALWRPSARRSLREREEAARRRDWVRYRRANTDSTTEGEEHG